MSPIGITHSLCKYVKDMPIKGEFIAKVNAHIGLKYVYALDSMIWMVFRMFSYYIVLIEMTHFKKEPSF
jgi:hypothetical protein